MNRWRVQGEAAFSEPARVNPSGPTQVNSPMRQWGRTGGRITNSYESALLTDQLLMIHLKEKQCYPLK